MDDRSALEELARKRLRIALALTAAMLVTYFGFLMLVAYAKDWLGSMIVPGLSIGILLGALVIVAAWLLTGIYVRWANRVYDTALAEVRAKAKAAAGAGRRDAEEEVAADG